MPGKTTSNLRALYSQIEAVCNHFKEIRSEAAGIVQTGGMPDAALHLNDVLQSTEEAASTILEAATAISYIAESDDVAPGAKEKLGEQVNRIYEASTFQDLSGQRIKKVMIHLNELETQLQSLAEAARGKVKTAAKAKDPLLNGPQLSSQAPSQDDIDKMFGSAG